MIEGLGDLISLDAKGLSGNNRSIRHCERSEATQGISIYGSVWVVSLSLAMKTSQFIYLLTVDSRFAGMTCVS